MDKLNKGLCSAQAVFDVSDNITFISVINQLDTQNFCFTVSLFHASDMFRAHVLVIRRSKIALHSLWYHHTYRWPSRAQVERGLVEPVELCRVLCVLYTAHDTAPQDHRQPQPTHPGRTPHAVGHGLILLIMGIMVPETY